MEAILTVAGAALGLLVPGLFAYALLTGVERAPIPAERKRGLSRMVMLSVGLWTAAVWALALSGWLTWHEGEWAPRVLLPLTAPLLLAVPAMASRDLRAAIDAIGLPILVGVQTFRLAGAAFFAVVWLGSLPFAFVLGGVGDLTTGMLAALAAWQLARGQAAGRTLFWAFTGAGLLDLTNVAVLLLYFWPSWNASVPSSAPLAEFSLVMIPALAAPMALLLHGMAVRTALRQAPAPQPTFHPAR